MPPADVLPSESEFHNRMEGLKAGSTLQDQVEAAGWISAPSHRLEQHDLTSLASDWQVPEVDLSKDETAAASDLLAAASEVGFWYVTNHGVPDELVQRQFAESAQFFAQPLEDKLQLQADSSNRGYHPPGLGTAKNPFKQADRKEAINLYLGFETDDVDKPFHGRNKWPDSSRLPGFRPAMTAFYNAMDAVSRRLLRLIALGLELPPNFFDDKFYAATSNIRAIHYLPGAHCAASGIFGVGAHTDWGMLTVLATDTTPGLQIRHGGAWHDVPPRPGAFVVNVGDLLHHWTGGRFRSTLHRVEKRTAGDRYSTPFFSAPNWDAVIEVLPGCRAGADPTDRQYPRITAGKWLMKRREAEYGAKQTLQIA